MDGGPGPGGGAETGRRMARLVSCVSSPTPVGMVPTRWFSAWNRVRLVQPAGFSMQRLYSAVVSKTPRQKFWIGSVFEPVFC